MVWATTRARTDPTTHKGTPVPPMAGTKDRPRSRRSIQLAILACMVAYVAAETPVQANKQLRKRVDPMPEGPGCPALSQEILEKHAKQNTVLVMCIDRVLFKRFAHSWVHNVQAAGITYWFVAALDPWSSKALSAMNVTQCFNAPPSHHGKTAEGYQWGNARWHEMTWKKVHVMRAVYKLGYNIIHSDADSTWHADPLPWFQEHVAKADIHTAFSTDSLNTQNINGDQGLEASTTPFFNINTGVYYMKQYPDGEDFFKTWLALERKDMGHDQDALQTLVRGQYWRGDTKLPGALWDTKARHIRAALHNVSLVGLLPIHLFGNAYTYNIGRVHKVLGSTLYVTHWVWTGGSPESKIQHIRDAMKYVDAPTWYGLPPGPDDMLYEYTEHPRPHSSQPLMLLTMGLHGDLELPPGYNDWRIEQTEDMVQFHLKAAMYQLQQTYWGILAAAGLGRTFVLPAFKCYCAKNWYMTQACRINGERHTRFPYNCSLSDFFKAKKVLAGINIPLSMLQSMVLHIRERDFLSHPRVPQEIKRSMLILRPKGEQPHQGINPMMLDAVDHRTEANGTVVADVPWPLDVEQLKQVVNNVPGGPFRVVHLSNATQLVGGGFPDKGVWAAFDQQIDKYKTYWCCRAPEDQQRLNLTAKEVYQIVPDWRRALQKQWQVAAGDGQG